jgi:hypothetical protein
MQKTGRFSFIAAAEGPKENCPFSKALTGTTITLDGEEVEIEADDFLGRVFQHEIDHLNGVLMFDRMTPEQRKEAMAEYRRIQEAPQAPQRRRLKLR